MKRGSKNGHLFAANKQEQKILTNCHKQEFARSHHSEQAVNVLENGMHHLILILRCWLLNNGNCQLSLLTSVTRLCLLWRGGRRIWVIYAHLVLGMGARMNNAVHVQVQIIELPAVGISLGGIFRDLNAIHFLEFLNDIYDRLWVFAGKPSKECRHSH